jgi:hypothetical protein
MLLDGWMDVKAILKIACSNQKYVITMKNGIKCLNREKKVLQKLSSGL